MKKKEKKMIAILVLVSVVIIGIIWIATVPKDNNSGNSQVSVANNQKKEEYVKVLEDGTKLNVSTKLNQSKKLEGLDIGNIQFTYGGGQSVILADVKNNSGSDSSLMLVILTLVDKEGNKIADLNGIIGALKAGESTQLNMGTSVDVANAYDFTIVKK